MLSYRAPYQSRTEFFSVILSSIFFFSIQESIGSSIRSPVITNVAIISYALINKSVYGIRLLFGFLFLAPSLSLSYCQRSSGAVHSFSVSYLIPSGDGICWYPLRTACCVHISLSLILRISVYLSSYDLSCILYILVLLSWSHSSVGSSRLLHTHTS